MGKPSRGKAQEVLEEHIARLPVRWRRTLRLHYRIDDPQDVRDFFAVAEEYVRALKKKALPKLREWLRPLTPAERRAQKAIREWSIANRYLPLLICDQEGLSLVQLETLVDNKRILARALRLARKNLNDCEQRFISASQVIADKSNTS
ncbi:hypothetical protein A3G63_01725 [Candidatus Kaiserbacteria bacterium RIFCSPLOWO2_12_FULL_52_8]|uniref:Uncharacterized protein n=1 Tax=Candidatus Kaiserbacteria bacterium RIFCSPHIGHO2_01_FULL_53_31 TaxID=1798481 RepID=A0A1F6CJ32_9BACT|nr:MAG: hypothetical protein A2678_02780 [Candidatus Kaiserbacteria bacterium RIFCSPHIGHO2_01_FULL_53_31]OGG94414.1 MAG: hypothetical protein A3G63_01725 [Candidatus Kaiserbacteria bacterium RIFCSPLOWO2_12_FULL_52_8]